MKALIIIAFLWPFLAGVWIGLLPYVIAKQFGIDILRRWWP